MALKVENLEETTPGRVPGLLARLHLDLPLLSISDIFFRQHVQP
jgi:hypothetical protein